MTTLLLNVLHLLRQMLMTAVRVCEPCAPEGHAGLGCVIIARVSMQALTGERVSTKAALLALEALFRSNAAGKHRTQTSQPMTVVLVDEMDLLVTRNQSVCPHFTIM